MGFYKLILDFYKSQNVIGLGHTMKTKYLFNTGFKIKIARNFSQWSLEVS